MDEIKVTGKPGNTKGKLPTKTLEGTKNRKPKNNNKEKRKWRIWQKILLWIFIVFAMFLLGGIGAFFAQRSRTKSQLEPEEQYITYNEKEYRYRTDIVNILCLGIDKNISLDETEERRDNIGMTDAILLVSLDTKRDEVKVIAVPRDSVAEIQLLTEDGQPGGKEKSRICRQYAVGRTPEESNQLTTDAVSRLLYNVPIQRCFAMNDNVLPAFNDAIGGVDVVVQEELEQWEPRLVYGETVHLDGELAYRFVNVRNVDRVDGALLRTQRQKQYVKAFADKAISAVKEDVSVAFSVLEEFRGLRENRDICTDITVDDMMYLLPEVLELSFSDEVIQVLPGESAMAENNHANYFLDSDAVIELVISTFYEEV